MNWTPEDAARAKSEGWALSGKALLRTYDDDGIARFYTTHSVYVFLLKKAKRSKWHADVYMSLPVTEFEIQEALREGLRWTRNGQIPNQRAAEALAFKAQSGSHLHQKILNYLARRRLGADQ